MTGNVAGAFGGGRSNGRRTQPWQVEWQVHLAVAGRVVGAHSGGRSSGRRTWRWQIEWQAHIAVTLTGPSRE